MLEEMQLLSKGRELRNEGVEVSPQDTGKPKSGKKAANG
jgi:hypothetical protein